MLKRWCYEINRIARIATLQIRDREKKCKYLSNVRNHCKISRLLVPKLNPIFCDLWYLLRSMLARSINRLTNPSVRRQNANKNKRTDWTGRCSYAHQLRKICHLRYMPQGPSFFIVPAELEHRSVILEKVDPPPHSTTPGQPSSRRAHFTASSTSLTMTFGAYFGLLPSLYTPVLTKTLVHSVPCGLSNSFAPRISLSGLSPTMKTRSSLFTFFFTSPFPPSIWLRCLCKTRSA